MIFLTGKLAPKTGKLALVYSQISTKNRQISIFDPVLQVN
jgi:hypothetical protein